MLQVWMKEKHSIHVSDTAQFQHKHITKPTTMPEDDHSHSNTPDTSVTKCNNGPSKQNNTTSATKTNQYIQQLHKVKDKQKVMA